MGDPWNRELDPGPDVHLTQILDRSHSGLPVLWCHCRLTHELEEELVDKRPRLADHSARPVARLKSASIPALVEFAFRRMPLFTEWCASSFEVILARQSLGLLSDSRTISEKDLSACYESVECELIAHPI